MDNDTNLGDTAILAAYTEGFLAGARRREALGICPYVVGDPGHDIWVIGRQHASGTLGVPCNATPLPGMVAVHDELAARRLLTEGRRQSLLAVTPAI